MLTYRAALSSNAVASTTKFLRNGEWDMHNRLFGWGIVFCLLFSGLASTQVKIMREPPAPVKPVNEAELIAKLSAAMDKLVADDQFSGAVLLAKDGKPIFEKAYGMASKGYGVANRTDTKFNVGSIDKIFTKIAIGQLIRQGKIASVDDKLIKYLPDYPNKDAAEKITLRQILTMQSGIGDFFGPKFEKAAKDQFRTISDYLPLFASEPLQFEPGTQRKYSNGGYIVLGAVIEKITGESYYDYVRQNIFHPLGMENTDFYEVDAVVANRASGYTKRDEVERADWRENVYLQPARGSSAGGGYSTLDDLLKFANAVSERKMMNPAFEAEAPIAPGQPFALMRGIGIAGGSPGVNGVMESGMPGGYTVIVLSNYDPPAAEKVTESVREWMGLRMD
jgi:CubicO group peptidase (beta-lactamase class C family)